MTELFRLRIDTPPLVSTDLRVTRDEVALVVPAVDPGTVVKAEEANFNQLALFIPNVTSPLAHLVVGIQKPATCEDLGLVNLDRLIQLDIFPSYRRLDWQDGSTIGGLDIGSVGSSILER